MSHDPAFDVHLRWLNENLQPDGPNCQVARAFRLLAEELIELTPPHVRELDRALELLVTAHDAAQRVATLANESETQREMSTLDERHPVGMTWEQIAKARRGSPS